MDKIEYINDKFNTVKQSTKELSKKYDELISKANALLTDIKIYNLRRSSNETFIYDLR